MVNKTESEKLFELFCNQHGIKCFRIPTKSKQQEKTPDYDIWVSGQQIVVEVKQFDPTQEEVAMYKTSEEHEFAHGPLGTPGTRVRKAINEKASQIRIRAKGKYPSILIIYTTVFWCDHTDP